MRATHPNQITDLMLVALNKNDVEAFCALYEDSAILVDDLEQPTSGRDAISDRMSEFLKLKPSFELKNSEVVQTSDLALIQSHWGVRWTDADRKAQSNAVDLTVVARRQENGHWLIAIDRPIEIAT